MNKCKLIISGLALLTTISPLNALAASSTTPIKATIATTPIDITVSNSINMTALSGKTDTTVSSLQVVNNTNVGVIELSSLLVTPISGWQIVSSELDFNKMNIDSHKFSLTYDNSDLKDKYVKVQQILPTEALNMILKGKSSISSTTLTNTKIADVTLTLGYKEMISKKSTLISGKELNSKARFENARVVSFIQADAFEKPEGLGDTWVNGVDVSLAKDGSIKAYAYGSDSQNDTNDVYIVSPNIIMAPEDCSEMFSGSLNLENADFSNFDTSNVTNMSGMFQGTCNKLVSLDLSSFKTPKLANMSDMFYDSNNLMTINMSSFDISNVTDISGAFRSCYKLKSIIGINEFNVSKVIDMGSAFYGCGNVAPSWYKFDFQIGVNSYKAIGQMTFEQLIASDYNQALPITTRIAYSNGIININGKQINYENYNGGIMSPTPVELNHLINEHFDYSISK